MTGRVYFRILGPLRADVQDRNVELEDGRARLVLASLLLEALESDCPVSTDALVRAVWDGEAPVTARTQIALTVSGLRRAFRNAGCPYTVIETVPPGYRIRATSVIIDALAAEQDIARARAALRSGQYEDAAERYRAALSLWDGPVLTGLHSASLVAGALRWERLQLTAAEEVAEVELALGRHDRLIGELSEWVAEYPFNERLRALLMTAFIRAGRHREALEVYSEGRRALREGLDLSPGRELRLLYESILLNGAWRHQDASPRHTRQDRPDTAAPVPETRPDAPKAPDGPPPRLSGPPTPPSTRRHHAPRGRYCAGAVPRANRWRTPRRAQRPSTPPPDEQSG